MPSASIQGSSSFPTFDNLKSAMEIAGASIEGADYLVARTKQLANNSKFLNKSPEVKANMIAAVERFADFVKFKLSVSSQPWSGQAVETSELRNMQENMADAAIKDLDSPVDNIKIDFAVSKNGNFVRAYTSDDATIDSEAIAAMDQVFSAWLATKDYLIKGGYLYNMHETNFDESHRVNAEEVENIINDGTLIDYMASKGMNATLVERVHPEEEQEAQAKQEVREVVEHAEQVQAAEVNDIEPEAPQTGIGA